MKSLLALRARVRGVGVPPEREDTFETLERPHGQRAREVRTGRTEQFNSRVAAGFGKRVRRLAKGERATLGEMLEAMMAAFEAQGGSLDRGMVPIAETRAGRTREMRFFASEFVYLAIGKVAAEREMSVSALLEELLAHEVHRLDPHGGKFGVYVKR
jgi:hypothetical protein